MAIGTDTSTAPATSATIATRTSNGGVDANSIKLSSSILPLLQAAGKVSMPMYDPHLLAPGILHIGVGNFHRSHLAAYMHDLHNINKTQENQKSSNEWGILGAGVLSFDDAKRRTLEPQDWLQTLVQRDATTAQATVLASMTGFVPVDYKNLNQHQPLQTVLMSPLTKIVSLTVTEGGYFLNGDGQLDTKHIAIQHDANFPDSPKTVFGMIVKALKLRKDSGMKVFTIMSCDNIPHNGRVVESVVVGMASLMHGHELAEWIGQHVAFPNSMVDRITPATTDEMRDYVQEHYGYQDDSPIFCEPFRQWVLEDNFSQGRPDWNLLENVTFVDDVAPFELMKLRVLNGGHASLCYPAALLDLPYVHSAMEHPVLAAFLDALETNEVIPTIPPVPGTSLKDYWGTIHERFSNPTICDTIGRICFDGASRQPKFIVPVIRDALQRQEDPKLEGLALVSAMWCRYCLGTTESGKAVSPNDPQWDVLQSTAQEACRVGGNPQAWLNMESVYGEDVGSHPIFSKAFSDALHKVQQYGVEAAMRDYCRVRQPAVTSDCAPLSPVDVPISRS